MRAGKGGIAGLAALVGGVVERAADGVVDHELVFRDQCARIGQRGRIRHRRSRRDRARIVVRNVRDRQRHDLGALPGARQPAALDPRQMLADGVDLADRRARAQQCPVHLLLLRERHALDRRDPVRRAAARQQHQQEIVGTGVVRPAARLSSAPFRPASSGTGWPASTTLIRRVGTPWPWRVVAMPDQPRRVQSELIEIMPLRRGRHRGGALAGGKADHPAFRHRAQMRRQHDIGMGGSDGGVEDRAQQGASVGHRVRDLMKTCDGRLSIRLRQKKTPAACCGGGVWRV